LVSDFVSIQALRHYNPTIRTFRENPLMCYGLDRGEVVVMSTAKARQLGVPVDPMVMTLHRYIAACHRAVRRIDQESERMNVEQAFLAMFASGRDAYLQPESLVAAEADYPCGPNGMMARLAAGMLAHPDPFFRFGFTREKKIMEIINRYICYEFAREMRELADREKALDLYSSFLMMTRANLSFVVKQKAIPGLFVEISPEKIQPLWRIRTAFIENSLSEAKLMAAIDGVLQAHGEWPLMAHEHCYLQYRRLHPESEAITQSLTDCFTTQYGRDPTPSEKSSQIDSFRRSQIRTM
jgi:hypothetical protein